MVIAASNQEEKNHKRKTQEDLQSILTLKEEES